MQFSGCGSLLGATFLKTEFTGYLEICTLRPHQGTWIRTLKTHFKTVVTIGCKDDKNLRRCLRKAHGSPFKGTFKFWIKGKKCFNSCCFQPLWLLLALRRWWKQTRIQTTQKSTSGNFSLSRNKPWQGLFFVWKRYEVVSKKKNKCHWPTHTFPNQLHREEKWPGATVRQCERPPESHDTFLD